MSGENSGVKTGLVLGGALPAIPADLLKRVRENSVIDLAEFLPDSIQEAVLYGQDGKRRRTSINNLADWVLAFCTFSQALLAKDPKLGGDLLTYVGTVARMAKDCRGQAWASYDRTVRGKITADPSLKWSNLDQAAWSMAMVPPLPSSSTAPKLLPAGAKRNWPTSSYCFKWNSGNCTYSSCKYTHACTICHNPGHKGLACPSAPEKARPGHF